MKDLVIRIANDLFQKAIKAEKAGDKDAAKYYYAQAAIKYLQSATYSKGIAYETRMKKAMECKKRIKNLSNVITNKNNKV